MKLDKSLPFGEGYGNAKWRFTQGDNFYNASGNQVAENGDAIECPTCTEFGCICAKTSDTKMTRDEHGQADNVKLGDLSWRAVKKLVTKNGGNWTNKSEGVMFLSKIESPEFEV
jgi:hypothetical protein